MTTPRVVRRVIRLTVATVLGLLCVGALATSGSAHAQLVNTTPSDGATLDAMPRSVVLTFSDPLDPQFVRLRITGPGDQVGTPTFTVAQGTVTAALPAMGPGAYVLAYRVVSKDGHPVSGQTTFTVKPAATDSPAATGTFVAVSPTDGATDGGATDGATGSPSDTPAPTSAGTPSPSLSPVSAGTLDKTGAQGSGLSGGIVAGIVAAVLVLGAAAWFAVGRRTR